MHWPPLESRALGLAQGLLEGIERGVGLGWKGREGILDNPLWVRLPLRWKAWHGGVEGERREGERDEAEWLT